MAWVILAHRYMLFLLSASNPNDILQVSHIFWFCDNTQSMTMKQAFCKTYSSLSCAPFTNHRLFSLQHITNWRYWWVFNAYPSVDTFLFISAFLVSVYLKERLHNFTFTGFYIQRYLRYVARSSD